MFPMRWRGSRSDSRNSSMDRATRRVAHRRTRTIAMPTLLSALALGSLGGAILLAIAAPATFSSGVRAVAPAVDTSTAPESKLSVAERTPPNRRENVKRILVTGGAGFIGSHLVDRLVSEGHMVIVADSLFTGRKSNLAKHFNNPRFEFIRHDVTQPLHVEVDQIYHLACPASPIHYKVRL